MDRDDRRFIERAVELARAAESRGGLPIGAVLVLDGRVVAEGRSRVGVGDFDPGRHAEIEAIESVDEEIWADADRITCYTTLEPCVMCTGTILVYGIGRVVFGARDPHGGGGSMLDHLPPVYARADGPQWVGPVMPEVCDPLYERARERWNDLPTAGASMSADGGAGDLESRLDELDSWLDRPGALTIPEARELVEGACEHLEPEERDRLLPYAAAIFRRGGYLKDYRLLERIARESGELEVLRDVEETVRDELPDVWVRRALEEGEPERAVDRWFECEGAPRLRHVADELAEACADDAPQLLISCRLAGVKHLIERGGRRRYRRACDRLRALRDELEQMGERRYWAHVIEELRREYDARPAFLDEMERAGFGVSGT